MWDQLTNDFPNGLYYLQPVYLYKSEMQDSHYIYVQYPLDGGISINIIMNITQNDSCSFYEFNNRKDIVEFGALSYVKRYFNLIDYRYVDSYRKPKHES